MKVETRNKRGMEVPGRRNSVQERGMRRLETGANEVYRRVCNLPFVAAECAWCRSLHRAQHQQGRLSACTLAQSADDGDGMRVVLQVYRGGLGPERTAPPRCGPRPGDLVIERKRHASMVA